MQQIYPSSVEKGKFEGQIASEEVVEFVVGEAGVAYQAREEDLGSEV